MCPVSSSLFPLQLCHRSHRVGLEGLYRSEVRRGVVSEENNFSHFSDFVSSSEEASETGRSHKGRTSADPNASESVPKVRWRRCVYAYVSAVGVHFFQLDHFSLEWGGDRVQVILIVQPHVGRIRYRPFLRLRGEWKSRNRGIY